MNETFDDMAKEVMRKIQRSDKHAFMVIRAALRKAYAEGDKDAQHSVQPTGYQTALIPCPHCGVRFVIDSDSLVASG